MKFIQWIYIYFDTNHNNWIHYMELIFIDFIIMSDWLQLKYEIHWILIIMFIQLFRHSGEAAEQKKNQQEIHLFNWICIEYRFSYKFSIQFDWIISNHIYKFISMTVMFCSLRYGLKWLHVPMEFSIFRIDSKMLLMMRFLTFHSAPIQSDVPVLICSIMTILQFTFYFFTLEPLL